MAHATTRPARARLLPRTVRAAGLWWLLLIAVRPVPLLVAAWTDPDAAALLAGWVGPTVAVLTVAAVLGSVWWGGVLGLAGERRLGVASVAVAGLVTAAWGFVLAAVWNERSDVNPEAAWATLGLAVLLTVLAAAAAIVAGYILVPKIAEERARRIDGARTGPGTEQVPK